ncbi:IclR family transcriptional regulator [Gulosibacter macacae]|nr:IclR family transcriptional regulator [Gulosibacter macacae]
MRNNSDEIGTSGRVQSVHRALMLLKMLGASPAVSVSEAAAELGVNASTAQRLLATLVADGFAVQDERRLYSAGPEFLGAGSRNGGQSLIETIRPYLERLFVRTNETVHLAVLIGTWVHHVDGVEATQHALRFGSRTGVKLPAHVTSAGRAMMSELSRSEVLARYLDDPQNSAGVRSIDEMEPILRMLGNVQHGDFGVNFGDSEDGVAAFGMSLGHIQGQHVGFSIAMPHARFTAQHAVSFRQMLRKTVGEYRADHAGGSN